MSIHILGVNTTNMGLLPKKQQKAFQYIYRFWSNSPEEINMIRYTRSYRGVLYVHLYLPKNGKTISKYSIYPNGKMIEKVGIELTN